MTKEEIEEQYNRMMEEARPIADEIIAAIKRGECEMQLVEVDGEQLFTLVKLDKEGND